MVIMSVFILSRLAGEKGWLYSVTLLFHSHVTLAERRRGTRNLSLLLLLTWRLLSHAAQVFTEKQCGDEEENPFLTPETPAVM